MLSAPITTPEAVVAKTALFGVAGWAAENVLFGPRYSPVFQGRRVPFLPVYAAGGLTMLAASPHLARRSAIARALVYAALGTAIEYAGCRLDRDVFEARSWDYGELDGLATKTDGCLSWRHTALWGGLGLLVERFV
jgi:uncharacterized membrane protein